MPPCAEEGGFPPSMPAGEAGRHVPPLLGDANQPGAGWQHTVTGAPAFRSACNARSELPHMTNCGVPFMNSVTGSVSITDWMRSRSWSFIRFLSS